MTTGDTFNVSQSQQPIQIPSTEEPSSTKNGVLEKDLPQSTVQEESKATPLTERSVSPTPALTHAETEIVQIAAKLNIAKFPRLPDSGIGSRSETPGPEDSEVKELFQEAHPKLDETFDEEIPHEPMTYEIEMKGGKTTEVTTLMVLGEGQSGIVHLVMETGKSILERVGEAFAFKTVHPHVEGKKAEADLIRGNSIHLFLRNGRPFKEIEGIQSTPHLVKIASKDGVKLGQIGRAYLGNLNDYFQSDEMVDSRSAHPEEHAKQVYSFFSDIVKGHLYLFGRGFCQLDNTLNNYYLAEGDRACIGDLDACYELRPNAEGKLSTRLVFPSGESCYRDVQELGARIDAFNEGAGNLREIKELAEKMVVFSTGCLLYEQIQGRMPYAIPADSNEDVSMKDERRYPAVSGGTPTDCDPFIACMLSLDPAKRPTLAEVHAFLKR